MRLAALMLAALASCAPDNTLVGAIALDSPVAVDAPAEAPDATEPRSDVSAHDAAPDAPAEATADASEVGADVAGDAGSDAVEAGDVRDASNEVDPCAGSCVSAPNTASLECIRGGGCVVRVCAEGFADCNRAAADGCETNITTRFDCRGCGVRCPSSMVCTSGGCR